MTQHWRMGPCMDKPSKKLIVMGDRVLIAPKEGEERTTIGLYLPATAVERQAVQTGEIVATGPGTPMAEPAALDEEPWRIANAETKFMPMQAKVGDCAIFFRKAAFENTFEVDLYRCVPLAACLVRGGGGGGGAEGRVPRGLAAILAADVVGYSRQMEADEAGTRARLRSLHSELIDPRIATDGGQHRALVGVANG